MLRGFCTTGGGARWIIIRRFCWARYGNQRSTITSRGLGGTGGRRSMITERGGTGKGGSIFVITENWKYLIFYKFIYLWLVTVLCVPTAAGTLGGASRIIMGGNVGGGGGRCPILSNI